MFNSIRTTFIPTLLLLLGISIFSGCGNKSGGETSQEQTPSEQSLEQTQQQYKQYNLKFRINSSGLLVSEAEKILNSANSKIIKAVENITISNEILKEQNISLKIAEVAFDDSRNVKFTSTLVSETDSNGNIIFYLKDFISSDVIDLSGNIYFSISFDYFANGQETEYSFSGSLNKPNGIVDSNGNLVDPILSFTLNQLGGENPPTVTKVDKLNEDGSFNKTLVDIEFDNVFRSREIQTVNQIPDYEIIAINENAKKLISSFNEYNSETDSITGKIGDVATVTNNSNHTLSLRLNLDRSNMTQWLDGVSEFQMKIEGYTYNFDIAVNGQNLQFSFQFAPYMQTFAVADFENRDYMFLTADANDPDGDNNKLTFEYSSNEFLIEQNGTDTIKLSGAERGVVEAVAIDEQNNRSKSVKFVIGSFKSMQECVNNALGLESSATPTTAQYQSITNLNCIDSGIEMIDSELISKLTNLESLDLSNNDISDISALANLQKLTSLNLSNNDISDISALESLVNIKTLNLSKNKIENLQGLESLNISELDLSNNAISDITQISENLVFYDSLNLNNNLLNEATVNNLDANYTSIIAKFDTMSSDSTETTDSTLLQIIASKIGISSSSIESISDIDSEKLDAITSLTISSSSVESLTGLSNLKNLKYLYIRYTKVSDLSEVSKLTKLEYLYMYYNRNITKLPSFTNLSNFKDLYISYGHFNLENIDSLADAKNLEYLSLYHGKFAKLPDLSKLTKLNYFRIYDYFDDSSLTDISGLAKVTSLKTAYISASKVTDISALSKNTALESLEISTSASDISILKNFSNLRYLYINDRNSNDSKISDFSPINDLKNLNYISLYYMTNKNLEFLENLDKLYHIHVSNGYSSTYTQHEDNASISILTDVSSDSELTDISALETLDSLSSLSISGAVKLTNLSPLSKVKNLRYLNLSGSKVSSLPSLDNLYSISLSSNPKLTDISGLDNSKISNFYSYRNQALDHDQVADINSIKYLTLNNSLSENISFIEDMNLTNLYIRYEYLLEDDLSAISSQASLSYLQLYSLPKVTKLPVLSNNLYYLYIGYMDSLTDVSAIKNLGSKLRTAYIYSNKNLKEVPTDLTALTGLYYVYFNYNQLSKIPDFSKAEGLKYLYLYRNKITDTSNLEKLEKKLYQLDLRYNYISSDDISSLRSYFDDNSITPTYFYYSNQLTQTEE